MATQSAPRRTGSGWTDGFHPAALGGTQRTNGARHVFEVFSAAAVGIAAAPVGRRVARAFARAKHPSRREQTVVERCLAAFRGFAQRAAIFVRGCAKRVLPTHGRVRNTRLSATIGRCLARFPHSGSVYVRTKQGGTLTGFRASRNRLHDTRERLSAAFPKGGAVPICSRGPSPGSSSARPEYTTSLRETCHILAQLPAAMRGGEKYFRFSCVPLGGCATTLGSPASTRNAPVSCF